MPQESNQPIVENTVLSLNNLLFKVSHKTTFVNKNDPTIEGPHLHDSFEIYVNVAGDVSFLVGDKISPVQKGEIAFSKPNVIHHCIYNKSCMIEHYVLWVKLPNDSPLMHLTRLPSFSPFISFSEQTKETLLDLLGKLFLVQEQTDDNGKTLSTAYLLQILAILNTGENLFSQKILNHTLPKEFKDLLNQIEKNFAVFNTVGDISKNAFVSTATINRWFRKYLHLSPKEYLLAKKLSHAKDLLSKGYTVAEAGYSAGFFDSSHFISVFKKRFKQTPYNYKKSTVN